MENINALLAQ
jgi:hypothetical protein